MDIERINSVLTKAILSFQEREIDEAVARGVTSYDVPIPGEKPMRKWDRTQIEAREAVIAYLKKKGLKVNKTNLRKIKKNSDIPRSMGIDHIGAWQMACDRLIDKLKSVKDYKRELKKLEKQQRDAHMAAMKDAIEIPGRAMGRKAKRDLSIAWRNDEIRRLKKKIAELGG